MIWLQLKSAESSIYLQRIKIIHGIAKATHNFGNCWVDSETRSDQQQMRV